MSTAVAASSSSSSAAPLSFDIQRGDNPLRDDDEKRSISHPRSTELALFVPRNVLSPHAITFGQWEEERRAPFRRAIQPLLDVFCTLAVILGVYDQRRPESLYAPYKHYPKAVITITDVRDADHDEAKGADFQGNCVGWLFVMHVAPMNPSGISPPDEPLGEKVKRSEKMKYEMEKETVKKTIEERRRYGEPQFIIEHAIADKVRASDRDAKVPYSRRGGGADAASNEIGFFRKLDMANWSRWCEHYNPLGANKYESSVTRADSTLNPFTALSMEVARKHARHHKAAEGFTEGLAFHWAEVSKGTFRYSYPQDGRYTFRIAPSELRDVHRRMFPVRYTIKLAHPHMLTYAAIYFNEDRETFNAKMRELGATVVPDAIDPDEFNQLDELAQRQHLESIEARRIAMEETRDKCHRLQAAVKDLGAIMNLSPTMDDLKRRIELDRDYLNIQLPPFIPPEGATEKERKTAEALHHRDLFNARAEARRLHQQRALADYATVMHESNTLISPARRAHCRYAAEHLAAHKTFCVPQPHIFSNLGHFEAMVATQFIVQEVAFRVHSAHCTTMVNEYAALTIPMDKPMKVHVFMIGPTATGKTVQLLIITEKMITDTVVAMGSESAQARFDGDANRYDWQLQTWEEAPPDMVGVKQQGGAQKSGNQATASDSAQTAMCAMFRVLFTASYATRTRLVWDESLKKHVAQILEIRGKTAYAMCMNCVESDIAENMYNRFCALTVTIKPRRDTSVAKKMASKLAPQTDRIRQWYIGLFRRDQYLMAFCFDLQELGVMAQFDFTKHDAIALAITAEAKKGGCKSADDPRHLDRLQTICAGLCLRDAIHRVLDSDTRVIDPSEPWTKEVELRFIRAVEVLLVIQPEHTVFGISLLRHQWEGAHVTAIIAAMQETAGLDAAWVSSLGSTENNDTGPRPPGGPRPGAAPATAAAAAAARAAPPARRPAAEDESLYTFWPRDESPVKLCTKGCGYAEHVGVRCKVWCPAPGCTRKTTECDLVAHKDIEPSGASSSSSRSSSSSDAKNETDGKAGGGRRKDRRPMHTGFNSEDLCKEQSTRDYIQWKFDDNDLPYNSRADDTQRAKLLCARLMNDCKMVSLRQAQEYFVKLLDVTVESEEGHGIRMIHFPKEYGKAQYVRIARRLFLDNDVSESVIVVAARKVLNHKGFHPGSYLLGMGSADHPFLLDSLEVTRAAQVGSAPFRVHNLQFVPAPITSALSRLLPGGPLQSLFHTPDLENKERNNRAHDDMLRKMSDLRSRVPWTPVSDAALWDRTVFAHHAFRGYFTLDSVDEHKCTEYPGKTLREIVATSANNRLLRERAALSDEIVLEYPKDIELLFPQLVSRVDYDNYERHASAADKRAMSLEGMRGTVGFIVGDMALDEWLDNQGTTGESTDSKRESKEMKRDEDDVSPASPPPPSRAARPRSAYERAVMASMMEPPEPPTPPSSPPSSAPPSPVHEPEPEPEPRRVTPSSSFFTGGPAAEASAWRSYKTTATTTASKRKHPAVTPEVSFMELMRSLPHESQPKRPFRSPPVTQTECESDQDNTSHATFEGEDEDEAPAVRPRGARRPVVSLLGDAPPCPRRKSVSLLLV
jgi:hypothetical protein